MHGQWKGLRGKGGAFCSGAFRYPLFGNAVYEGLLVSGRRHGAGRQVCHSGVYEGACVSVLQANARQAASRAGECQAKAHLSP
jgi:hypothetical protein